MKKFIGLSVLLTVLSVTGFAQGLRPLYTIAPWLNNKKAAVSLTFDDGIAGQFNIAVPLLNKHHFKATFFVTTQLAIKQMGDWKLVNKAAAAGHEIANHSFSHPHFDSITAPEINQELIASDRIIIQNLPSQLCLTHAYPYGEGGKDTPEETAARQVVKKYFIGARATRVKPIAFNEYKFATKEDDYFKINSDMIADSASMADFHLQVDKTIAAGGWYVPTYHGIENGWIITPEEIFKKHLDYLDSRKADLWIAPFADVVKYHRERDAAKLLSMSENKHMWILSLNVNLPDDFVWDEPMTITLSTGTRPIAAVQQFYKNVPFKKNADSITFNAVPGDAQIVIIKE